MLRRKICAPARWFRSSQSLLSSPSAPILGLFGFGKGTMINYLKPWGDAISLGLDLRGGVYTVYQAENNGDPDFDTKMESTVSILTSRLTRQGFTEATVTRQGSDRIRVEIPNVS